MGVRALVVLLQLLTVTAIGAPACSSGTTQARVAGALDLLAHVIDPSYRLAMDACIAAEHAIAASVSARRTSYADGEAQLAHLRAECDRTRAVFADLRILQDEAATLVERGAVEQAQQLAERIKATWDELPAGEPDAGPPIVTQLDGGAPP